MTNSQYVLINLLKKSLFGFDFDISKEIDWRAVYNEAVFQSVVPLAFDGTAGIETIPEDVYKDFKDYTISVLLKNDCVVSEQKGVVKLLEENGFKYAVLKGTSVARLYNKPTLRTLGDIDILVKPDDYGSVKDLMISKGYSLTEEGFNHFHCAFEKNGVSVELHHEMSEFPKTPLCDELREELKKALDCTERTDESELGYSYSVLSPLYQAVSLLLHMERHLRKSGLGIRQLLDWGVFERTHSEMLSDTSNIVFLKKYGLYKFAVISKESFESYLTDTNIEDKYSNKLFELAFKKGNFGVKRSEEESYATYIISSDNKSPLKWFRYFKTRSIYSWEATKKHKWLSNFAFIVLPVRYLFRVIFGKRKMINYNKLISESDSMSGIVKDLGVFKNDSKE